MKDVIDVSQVVTLGRQLFPGRSKVLTVSYTDALSVGPYSFLIVDASPHSEENIDWKQTGSPVKTPSFIYQNIYKSMTESMPSTMSKLLEDQHHFLKLLQSTSKLQRKA